jgi:transcriptional regulator GlxA family with amidase domain
VKGVPFTTKAEGAFAFLPRRAVVDCRVAAALALLNNNDAEAATLTQIASLTNLSPSRLRHLFKQEVGVSIARYVRLTRYAKARNLLQTGFSSVKEVVGLVGAKDVSHFIRDYKRTYGETPKQTRLRTFSVTRR